MGKEKQEDPCSKGNLVIQRVIHRRSHEYSHSLCFLPFSFSFPLFTSESTGGNTWNIYVFLVFSFFLPFAPPFLCSMMTGTTPFKEKRSFNRKINIPFRKIAFFYNPPIFQRRKGEALARPSFFFEGKVGKCHIFCFFSGKVGNFVFFLCL